MKYIRLSVRNIVEYVLMSGNLDATVGSLGRMQEGTKVHRMLQSKAPEGYESEYEVKSVITHEDFIFDVQGRIDLAYLDEESQSATIEEIKTVSGKPDAPHEVHFAQAAFYAYLLSLDVEWMNLAIIKIVYYDRLDDTTKVHERVMTRVELEEYVLDILSSFIRKQVFIQNLRCVSRESISELVFPFDGYRKNQRDFMKAVYVSIREGKKLYSLAPTGTGKTISTIFPALKVYSEGEYETIYYITAKTVGRLAAEDTIKLLQSKGYRGKALSITAKEKVCMMEEVDCNPEKCEYARGFYDRLQDAISDICQTDDYFDRESVEKAAKRHVVCPFELSLELIRYSEIVVCDYNYVFDPRVSLKRVFEDEKKKSILLIDESHNLIDRVREMYSVTLDKEDVLQARRGIKDKKSELYKAISKINKRLLESLKELENEYEIFEEFDDKLIRSIQMCVEEAARYLAQNSDDVLLDLYYNFLSVMRILGFVDDDFVMYRKKITENNLRTRIMLFDTSRIIRDITSQYHSVVYFSATLIPIDYYRDFTGATHEDFTKMIDSPFDSSQLDFRIVPVSTRYRDRTSNLDVLTKEINMMVNARKGNYLVFFPSYEYLELAYDSLIEESFDYDLMKQSRGFSEDEKADFLSWFRLGNERTVVGLAVLGGVFSEGIDLVGDRLTGVFITGVGIPKISFERELMKDYFDKKSGNGYYLSYILPGMNKVIQAGGRLIRSHEDRGTLVLFGDRFNKRPYVDFLPREWF